MDNHDEASPRKYLYEPHNLSSRMTGTLLLDPSGDGSKETAIPDTPKRIDPWKMQGLVMLMSGQSVPDSMTFGKGSITYFALVAEEFAEFALEFVKMMEKLVIPADVHTNILSRQFSDRTTAIRQQVFNLANGLNIVSKTLRSYVANVNNGPWEFAEFDPKVVKDLLDGVTDLMVVAAGFSVTTGLPGAAAFQEVTASNMSKANPDTGLIDLDDTGKWIKGPSYVEPDLLKLITWKKPD